MAETWSLLLLLLLFRRDRRRLRFLSFFFPAPLQLSYFVLRYRRNQQKAKKKREKEDEALDRCSGRDSVREKYSTVRIEYVVRCKCMQQSSCLGVGMDLFG